MGWMLVLTAGDYRGGASACSHVQELPRTLRRGLLVSGLVIDEGKSMCY